MKSNESSPEGREPNTGATPETTPDPKRLMQILETLRPLADTERLRTVEAALTFLGTPWGHSVLRTDGSSNGAIAPSETKFCLEGGAALPRRAQTWIAQNKLTTDMLANVFHWAGTNVEIIAHDLPGNSGKEKLQECVLLCGVRCLLESGIPKTSDDEIRKFSRELGCYNGPNYATYLRSMGNLISGSRTDGHEVTQPGLRAAADVIRRMNNETGPS